MKKIIKYLSMAVLVLAAAACYKTELDTDPLSGGVRFAGMAPNPVMRGGVLQIMGHNLDQVKSVEFAGGVTLTDFVKISKGTKLDTLHVMVPLEGPEVGKVSIVSVDGERFSSFSNLEYSEPIEAASFSPTSALSGDVITIKGEYLQNVKSVIFGGDIITGEIVSQDRHELKVTVPSQAVSGYIILSDVDEIEDPNTIPNHIYTQTELTIGKPTVVKAEKATYKAGDEITVTGEHLDMIDFITVPGAGEVAPVPTWEDGACIAVSFILPGTALDGNIILTSFAGDEFDAGEIETVKIEGLAVKSLAEDQRFKAGTAVEITGTDLDLVAKVEFTGAEAAWYYADGKIIATVPDGAKDGGIGVTTESGLQGWTAPIEVVKPNILAWEHFDAYVAGETVVRVEGLDLDLVKSVVIGDKAQGFIPCEFKFVAEDGTGFVDVDVTLPEQAYTGPITFTSAAGYETATDPIVITYNMAVDITYDQDSYALGTPISISGKNLLQIEQIFVKDKKVTSYSVKADDKMVFNLPEEIVSPGVYRLNLVLVDGTTMTWPVPFEVTASFTEITIWEGSEFINGWSGKTLGDNRFVWAENGIKEGDVVKIYYSAPADSWWDLQLVSGHWTNLSIEELGGGNEIKSNEGFAGTDSFAFNVTASVLASLTEDVGWGGAFIINGDGGVTITKISLIQYGSSKTYLWQGDIGPTNWDGNVIASGVEGLDTLQPGMTMGFEYYVEDGAEVGQVEFMGTWWTQFPSLMNPDGSRKFWEFTHDDPGYLEFELAQADIDIMKQQGFLFCGNGGLHITGIYVL